MLELHSHGFRLPQDRNTEVIVEQDPSLSMYMYAVVGGVSYYLGTHKGSLSS